MYIWELTPNAYLSRNEIDAASTVRFEQFNAQDQPHFVWPATFSLARAYVDQLERNAGLSSTRIAAVRSALDSAEGASGSARSGALSTLASSLISDVQSASDRGRVARLARVVQDLASGE